MTRRSFPRYGFTMIEMLLVIVVFASIVALMTSGNQTLRTAAQERAAIHMAQSVITSGQLMARQYSASVIAVTFQQGHAWITRDGTVVPPYTETLPAGMTTATVTTQINPDGTLSSDISTTLTTPQVTYALTIDRSGTVRVQ